MTHEVEFIFPFHSSFIVYLDTASPRIIIYTYSHTVRITTKANRAILKKNYNQIR